MATWRKKEEEKVEIGGLSTDQINVAARIKTINDNNFGPKPAHTRKLPRCLLCQRFFGSRFSGLVLGPVFGLFLYYYITYLILNGPPFTRQTVANLTETPDGNSGEKLDVNTPGGATAAGVEEIVLIDNTLSHIIGGSIGSSVGALLVVGGAVSRRTRCAMLLMVPSLVSKRGRAFMISAAAGFLLSGPLATTDSNIQEVVRSITCLYENMKEIGQQYVDEFQKIFQSFQTILSQANALIAGYTEQLSRLARSATAEARAEIEKSRKAVEKQAKQLKESLEDVKDILNAPSNALGEVCGAGKSAVSWVEDRWGDFKGLFGKRRRRKRNACGIPDIELPNVDLNIPEVRLEAFKDFLKKLNPDINLVDFDLDQIVSQLEANSITDIRQRLKTILKAVFDMVRIVAQYASKVFYLSILLIIWDAFYYMHMYYSDDAFDNMFVDDNLRQLWRTGDKEKILPLRKWELQMKYQYSTSIKLSKKELKHILIQSIPTIVFTVIATSILGFDAALTSILVVFRENAKFGIAYQGMEAGVSFKDLLPGVESGDLSPATINLRGFNLTTEPCLPNPLTTDYQQTAIIAVLVILCITSCLLDAFGSRLRARICNIVFTERALQRAEYLYKRIKAGRASRRIHFNMIICHQLDIMDRKAEFCFCCRSCGSGENRGKSRWFGKVKSSEKCLGCEQKYTMDQGKVYKVTHKGQKKEVFICPDCHIDSM